MSLKTTACPVTKHPEGANVSALMSGDPCIPIGWSCQDGKWEVLAQAVD